MLSAQQRRTVQWVGALFLSVVLFQRFAVPGLPLIGLLVPVVLVWMAAATIRGIVVFDDTRLTWWFAAAAVTGLTMLAETQFVPRADISVLSWALVITVWFPFTVRLKENSSATYFALLAVVAKIATALSVVTILMVGTQFAGIPYRDVFADVVPQTLQLGGFILTYPIKYGSPIFRGNGWIGLEPSMVSLQIGVGLLAALFVGARVWMVLVLMAGLIATVSGSGIIIVVVGVLVMLVHRSRRVVVRYAVLGLLTAVASVFTPFGQLLINRSTEVGTGDSSASLRALQPYSLLFPKWVANLPGMVFGYGPGSSQRIVTDSNILGLLVPSPVKVFFEYGLVAGVVLAAFILGCYWGGPSRTFGFTLLFSLWVLQPGITTSAVVIPLLVLVTLWAPRTGPPIEALIGRESIGRRREVKLPLAEHPVNATRVSAKS